MPKNSILDWSLTDASNTDIGGVDINEGCPAAGINDAIRKLMAQVKAGVDYKTVLSIKTGNYTAVANDNNAVIRFSAAATLSLTAAATLGANWHCWVMADGGAVIIDPNGSETINGSTTITIPDGWVSLVVCNGTSFFCQDPIDPTALVTLTGLQTLTDKTLIDPRGLFLSGYITGLTLSNGVADPVNDISIAAGVAASDTTTPVLMNLSSAIQKRLDASWAVGTGNGGLDTGTIANTTYHVFLIGRTDTGVIDAIFSASPTSPTLPANYDMKRRIGSFRRVGGSIVAFTQIGDYFKISPTTDRSSTSAAVSALLTLSVPTGITVRPLVTTVLSITAINTSVVIALGDGSGASADTSVAQIATDASTSRAVDLTFRDDFFTNTSGQIFFSQTNSSGTPANSELRTSGWIDTRGR